MLPFFLSLAFGQDCPDASVAVKEATEHMLMLEDDKVAESLATIEASFSCAWLNPDSLASYWLLKGATEKLAGNDPKARDAFAMAQAVAPDAWLSTLGPDLKELYDEEAVKARPRGALDVINVSGYTVRIDGRVTPLPAQVIPGIHILQVGKGEVEQSRQVVSIAGQGTTVDLGLSESVVTKTPSSKSTPIGLNLHAGLGFGAALGEETSTSGLTEPANKLLLPIEAGLTLRFGPGWVRAQGGYAPLLGSQALYLKNDEVAAAKAFILFGGSAGVSAAGFDIGALFAQVIPSRNALRLIVARDIVGPLGVEVRGGTNLHPKRGPEPAFELLAVVRPSIL